jgi:hypothetical protein
LPAGHPSPLPSAAPALDKAGTNSNPLGLPGPVTSIALDPATRRLWVAVFGSGVYSSDNASTLSDAQNASVDWADMSGNLPAGNRNVIRLQLDAAGLPYCLITATRNVVTVAGGDKQQTTFKHAPNERTGLWHLSSLNGPWQSVTPDPFIDSQNNPQELWYITDFLVHRTNPQVLYLSTGRVGIGQNGTGAVSGSGVDGGVYKTSDGGQHWNPVLTLGPTSLHPSGWLPPDYRDFVHISKLTQDPDDPETIYAGTLTHGLWVSPDGGARWSEFQPRLPFMSIHRVAFDYQQVFPGSRIPISNRVLYITTYGSGVLKVTQPWWMFSRFLGAVPRIAMLPLRQLRRRRPQAPGSLVPDRTPSNRAARILFAALGVAVAWRAVRQRRASRRGQG